MNLFTHPQGTALLYRNRLEFFLSQKPAVIFQFPPKAASDMEIKDKWEFKKSLIKFLNANKLKHCDWFLVLSPELIFEKRVTAIGQDAIDKAIGDFKSQLPFPKENIDHRLIMKEGRLFVHAQNRDLFQTVADTIRNTGGKIISIATENKKEVIEDKPQLNWFQRISRIFATTSSSFQSALTK